jgi:hypothetical protein
VAIQVKMAVRASARSAEISAIQQQVAEAFRLPIADVRGRARELAAEVWVIVASRLSEKARTLIVDGLEDPVRKANVRFFDRSALEELHAAARDRQDRARRR